MPKKKTNKQIAQKALKDAEMYLLITFDRQKVGVHSDIRDGGLIFMGAMELQKQQLIKRMEDLARDLTPKDENNE